jgi:hypothetical protein
MVRSCLSADRKPRSPVFGSSRPEERAPCLPTNIPRRAFGLPVPMRGSVIVAKVHTQLPTSADHAWRVLTRHDDIFRYGSRGVFGSTGSDRWPEEFHDGQEIDTRIVVFHLIPAWGRQLHLIHVDDERREVLSWERGGFIRLWIHRIRVEPENTVRCRYTDEVRIQAGLLTPAVWAFAHLYCRYRQIRLRRLIRWLARIRLLRR